MNNRFDWAILEAINNAISTVKASPLILGGVTGSGGGAGGPIGGVVGYLTQTRVAYDLSEVESSGVPASGMSLLDNLNHIRYRVGVIESGGSGHFIEDEGIPLTDRPTLNFIGSGVTVYDDELNNETVVSISGSEGVVSFIDLTDTPSEYSGNTGKAAIVNSTEDGIEFGTINNGITVFSGGGEVISGATGIDFIGAGVAYSGLTATVTITQSGGGAFQRVLSENLTLASGESLVIAEYLDLASNDFTLDGDSVLYFVDDHTKDYNTIAVWDDAVPVGDFLTLDLIGDQITITPSGTVVRVEVAVPSGAGITDAPSNDIYYGRRNSGWTNLKTYFDTLYSTLSSMSAANALDLTEGGVTTLHTHAGPALPKSATMWHDQSLVLVGGQIETGQDTVPYYTLAAQTAADDGDSWSNGFYIRAGTYTLNLLIKKSSSSGLLDLYIDDSLISSGNDFYHFSDLGNQIITIGSVIISSDGYHSIKGIVNGKNASSAGYWIYITKMWLVPSAY